jgi:hypothetical protein
MSAENITNRVEDQTHDSKGKPHLDLLKKLVQGGAVRMYENTGVRDFAYGKAGDVKAVDKISTVDVKNRPRAMQEAEDVKTEDKIGALSLEDEHSAATKTDAVSAKDGFVTLSNAVYVLVEKKKAITVNFEDKRSTEAEMGVVDVKGKKGPVYFKNKNAPMNIQDKKMVAVVEDIFAAADVKDTKSARNIKGKDTVADTKEKNATADVKDRKVAVAVQDDSDDYLNEGSLFDMEDFVCKYTHSGSMQC